MDLHIIPFTFWKFTTQWFLIQPQRETIIPILELVYHPYLKTVIDMMFLSTQQ